MKIEIKGLSKSYGRLKIYENLNLNLEGGKMIVLYGQSGCGKTTLLNMIGLIEDYQGGKILYDGEEIRSYKKKRKMLRDKFGFIFQDFGLIENESIINNLKVVYKVSKMKDATTQAEEVLKQMNLNVNLKRKIYELSGGEQQRVAIAKAILKDAQIILADEPTASLDEENKMQVLSWLKAFAAQGKNVIVVSHDAGVRELADEVINLEEYRYKGEMEA
ncbi:MAG: ATP-binding cassette domain-containing protein [Erysipelotrichaceae bacterium]|nr:ATP-binding cassette domain-containing protein [Erysipelotrichaceae bacterium]MDY5252739.1 ATP-binding cassette domain-containing protein [Erysipelotrichaceae bacterium]